MSFPQGGQVDWVSVASGTLTMATGMLGRMAQAGVDPYTLQLANMFGSQFNILETYLDNIETQMVNTRKFGFSADILFIGTGISVVPRLLARTRGGASFTAITVALMSSFQPNYTARVLVQMLRTFCPEQVIVPSISQLESLTNEISSSVRDGELGKLIWGIERLLHDKQDPLLLKRHTTAPPMAEDMSKLIFSLSTLAPGEEAIIRSTWANLTWVAAFAHRVLGLSVIFQCGSQVIWEPQVDLRTNERRAFVRLIYSTRSATDGGYEVLKPVKIECGLNRPEMGESTWARISVKDCATFILNQFFPDSQIHNCVQEFVANVAMLYLRSEVYMFDEEYKNIPAKTIQMLPFSPIDAHRALRDMFGSDFEFKTYEEETISTSVAERERLIFGSEFRVAFKNIMEKTPGCNGLGDEQGVTCALKSLVILWTTCLFLDSTEEIQFEGKELLELLKNHEQVYRNIWKFRHGGVRFLQYMGLLQQILCFMSVSTSNRLNTVAVARGGIFLAMGSVIEDDQDLRGALRFITGRGGIFANGKAVPILLSFGWMESSRVGPVDFVNGESLNSYTFRSTCNPEELDPTDATKLTLYKSIYAREGRHGTEVAYHINARAGIDMVIEIFISHLQIIKAELDVFRPNMHYQETKLSEAKSLLTPAPCVETMNIEAYLKYYADYNRPIILRKRTVILCHGNSAARIIATCVGTRGQKIKQPPGTSLEHWAQIMEEGDFLIIA
ncbi:hypothetical protein K440DRAFT_645384 [Wilcoxina mikolae CBS 423.85]|nr:hypothetical protein K440DRAFT_645384 [Wilcoxina mikolae CBS 423.85]